MGICDDLNEIDKIIAEAEMQEYYGTKRVTAWPSMNGDRPGYSVTYKDGYTSWSPKEVFEEAYQLLNALSFGHAIQAMKEGHRVARSGWNGKGMWVYIVRENRYAIDGTLLPVLPFIALKTVDDTLVPWLASQADMLANDWTIIE